MANLPRVSIIIPLFNDEDFVARALQSCLKQTLADIEIICVDDASDDRTVAIVEEARHNDARIRLVRQPENLSAFQARRVGIEAASAPYVLFLDGDDELAPQAAAITLRKATSSKADVVGFGVDVIAADSRAPRRFEAALQPKFSELRAPNIIPSLFPVGEDANGHVWRYLFATSLLKKAYEGVQPNLTFYRANDLPITFLALANASKYVSTSERLYRYNFRRGTSGHVVDSLERFAFLVSGVEPITSISAHVNAVPATSVDRMSLQRSYESARLHIIATVLRSCVRETSGSLQRACLAMLEAKVGRLDLIRAGAAFCKEALDVLSLSSEEPGRSTPPKQRSVLLHTAHLDTGGLQSVLLTQAGALAAAGYRVTIAVLRDSQRKIDLPPGVTVELMAGNAVDRIDRWLEICRDHSVDVIIDHHILYNENWAWHALAALGVGIPTIGWIHNFALRPIFDANKRTSFLTTHLRLLWRVVVLSTADVAFWKLRGIEHVVYLPNPLSPLAMDALNTPRKRSYTRGRVELVWWGRLDGPTKQVLDLAKIARELKTRRVDFRLRIIGPDSKNLSAGSVQETIQELGVSDRVELLGERTASELPELMADAHALLSTSAIEGSPLTLLEAQALGLPILMYDLPWLMITQGNDGMVRTPPNDPASIADAVRDVFDSPSRYRELSDAAFEFARNAATVDVDGLTISLLRDTLPASYASEPTLADSRLLIDWLVRFSELSYDKDSGISASSATRRELDRTRRRLNQITDGPSFRIGRVITFVPRKASEAIRRLRSR